MLFIKPFKIKSNNQLKTTERKKLCELILLIYPCLTEEDVQTLLPKKESVTLMKIVTHNDQQCKVYCVAGTPMFFELTTKPQLFPTIYTLWHYPNLLYSFTSYTELLPKLFTGADLMSTDINIKPNEIRTLSKHMPVSLNTSENKAPIAVGINTADIRSQKVCGTTKCMEIYHIMGDALCQIGKPQTRPNLEPPNMNNDKLPQSTLIEDNNSDNIHTLNDIMDELELADAYDADDIDYISEEQFNELEEMEELEENDTNSEHCRTPECVDPKKEMDDLLIYCFLKACKTTLKPANLPILSSNFFKKHLLPACPPDKTIDIKKSQYKKLSVFLADMKAKGLINTSITKGVESIISVEFKHHLLQDLTINEEMLQSQEVATNKVNIQANSNNFSYKVNSTVYPILSQFGYEKGDTIESAKIKECFTSYVIQERLLQGKNVYISPQLGSIFKTKVNQPLMNMEEATSRFLKCMNLKRELISMRVAMRNKGKKATLVNNLEVFGINSKDFSRECQSIGASATVTLDPGKKTPCVFIQGNQILYVHKLLTEKYGIKPQNIRGLEFAPKKPNPNKKK